MRKNNHESGFAVIELVIIISVLAAVGFVGYKIKQNNSSSASRDSANTAASSLPAKIQSKAEVTMSIKALDDTATDKKLDPSQLDADISTLL